MGWGWAERCFALLWILLWKEQGLVSACSFLSLAALLTFAARRPPCLLPAARGGFGDVYRVFFSLFFPWLLGPVIKTIQTSNPGPRVLRLWVFNSAFGGSVSGSVRKVGLSLPALQVPSPWCRAHHHRRAHRLCSTAQPAQRLSRDQTRGGLGVARHR